MRSFKTRLILAMIMIVVVTWAYQGQGQTRATVESWLSYATTKNYDVSRWLKSVWIEEITQPAVSTSALRLPCSFTGVARHFGWYYNPRTGTQAFNPGVVLKIEPDTPVYPVLRGTVSSVTLQENGYQVVLQHGDAMVSVIRGLREVTVKTGETVEESTPLGWGADLLYLEIKNKDGPINPEGFLEKDNPA